MCWLFLPPLTLLCIDLGTFCFPWSSFLLSKRVAMTFTALVFLIYALIWNLKLGCRISLEETSSPYQDTTHILSWRRRRGRHCVVEGEAGSVTEGEPEIKEDRKQKWQTRRGETGKNEKKEERTEQRGAGGRRKEEKLTGLVRRTS